MRLFRQVGGSKRRNRRKQASSRQTGGVDPAEVSIGSELAASDQFEILVANKAAASISNNEHRRKNKGTFLSYFSSDNDDSTVSSITTGDYGGFFNGKNYNTSSAAQSLSSLCCCGETDNTQRTAGTNRTFPSSTDNTLIQSSTFGTVQPTDSRSYQFLRSPNGSRCGPQDYSVIPNGSRRPFFSSYWGRSRNHSKRLPSSTQQVHNMSASLFDNLSEDDVDIDIQRSYSFGGASRRGGTGKNSSRPVSLRRVLTWKRRA